MHVYGVSVLPNGMLFQQPLDGDRELPQEALDDWPTLGKLVLHLNLQDISRQGHKVKPLETQTDTAKGASLGLDQSVPLDWDDICVCSP